LKGATRGARTGVITKAIKKSDPFALYSKSVAAKKEAKKALRAKLTDFDRFRVLILRKRVYYYINF
jgi:large subunit ribosomal protein L14e